MATRSQWDETIKAVQGMGYPQNPAAPPAPRPNSFGDAAAAMNNPGVTQPRSTFGSMAAQAATPATAQAPGAAAELPEWSRGQSSYGDQMRSVGQALMNVPKHIVSAPGYGLNSDMQRPGETSEAFAQRRTGPSPQDAPAPAAPGTPAAPNPTDQRLAAGTQAAPMGLAAAALASPPPAASPATPDNQVMPGVFNHGRGQYSDQAGGMGMPSSFTGQPNAQNLAAAEALSQRGAQAALAQPPRSMMEAAGITAPTVRHSGNDWQARNDLRNAQVSASSITNDGGRWDQHKGVSAARAYAAGLEQADTQARFAQPAFDMKTAQENAGLQREGMQQQGANQRSMVQAMLEQQRINQAGETAGYANRAAAQTEQLRNTLLNPQSTPEQRKQAQSALQALQGKQYSDNLRNYFMTAGGGQEWDQQAGAMRNVPQRLIDLRTGQEVGGAPTQAPQYEVGKVYVNAKGERARRTETGWAPA